MAYETYQQQIGMVGLEQEEREPLVPVAHMISNAHIEIMLDETGDFIKANRVSKTERKTLIPITIDSSSRTSTKVAAHPISDQLCYLASVQEEKYNNYCEGLEKWTTSIYSHPKVEAISAYIQRKTILQDLAGVQVVELDEEGRLINGKIEGIDYEKCLVRWRVVGQEDVNSACWKDVSLMDCYTKFYLAQLQENGKDYCMLSGEEDILCTTHPKGTIAASTGAKLLSANDSSGFTYRGRFISPEQAFNVGYISSQKAHNALHWIAATQGVIMGGRTFLCWNPEGAETPRDELFGHSCEEEQVTFEGYKKELQRTLDGYAQSLAGKNVVIASLDAATTGRLSVTYYNELEGSDLLARIQYWYETFCWNTRFGVQAPSLRQVARCAFGSEKGEFIDLDDKILREQVQRLLNCIVNKGAIPADIVQALAAKASTPLAYKSKNREYVLVAACAAIRKYRNDKQNKEVWTLTLDTSNRNRSYLYGRLLAITEKVERDTYDREEKREPKAIRMQAVFVERPAYAFGIIHKDLAPYLNRQPSRLRGYYRKLIGEVIDLFEPGDFARNQRLEDVYLEGYYNQRTALYQSKNKNNEEESES